MSLGESVRTWTKVHSRAVDSNASTTHDSVDNVRRPPLSTFRPLTFGQRSTKVDSDAVDAVTTLSTPFADSVDDHAWGPLSGFVPADGARTGLQQPHEPHAVDAVTALTRVRTLSTSPIEVVQGTFYYLSEPNSQVGRLVRTTAGTCGHPRRQRRQRLVTTFVHV